MNPPISSSLKDKLLHQSEEIAEGGTVFDSERRARTLSVQAIVGLVCRRYRFKTSPLHAFISSIPTDP